MCDMMHDDERNVEEEEYIQQELLHSAHPLNFPATVINHTLFNVIIRIVIYLTHIHNVDGIQYKHDY